MWEEDAMPSQDKDAGVFIDEPGMDTTSTKVSSNNQSINITSENKIHKIKNDEEDGVYFLDGLRKIDLVLAYEGKYQDVSQPPHISRIFEN